jgi:proton-coupled amino acid transporter
MPAITVDAESDTDRSFGVLGYFASGEETKDIITTNLGQGWISTLVQLGLYMNLFFTLPLMMNPVYEVIERRFCGSRYCMWQRWVVILGVSLIALLVPIFADFLSLVGSSVCIVLGFVLPALFHLLVFKEEMSWIGMVLDGGYCGSGDHYWSHWNLVFCDGDSCTQCLISTEFQSLGVN